MKLLLLLPALVALATSKSIQKRNAYGDEQVMPAPAAPAPGPPAPIEQAPVAVQQPAPAPDCNPVQPSAPAQPSGELMFFDSASEGVLVINVMPLTLPIRD
ncbi:hypothetical protein GCK32_019726 [Trichostrongylus colubriformis]|uniref:Uncharacterized protein n=1 Tax=Trichostrongylus colubriformis TaxID=6319 RepID=A0AAN8F781_TRICO